MKKRQMPMFENRLNFRFGRRFLSVWLLFLLVPLSVVGCGTPSRLEKAMHVVDSDLSGHWTSRSGSSLVLRADGKFSAESLNSSYTKGAGIKVVAEETVEGSGSWTFGDYGAGPEVDLDFSGGGGLTLRVAALDGDTVMWAWVGDGDQSVLEKRGS
ncbi:hypothetical protein ACFVWY_25730 [Streptomyces sp. NPDC058195]|uniref:hypothetical protein n=1 Tax=Streptomyces sp. NPDC058195 TaxID=3346375 RepID=UPI0036ECC3E0